MNEKEEPTAKRGRPKDPEKMTGKINFYLGDKDKEAFNNYCWKERKTMSEMVRELVLDFIAAKKKK